MQRIASLVEVKCWKSQQIETRLHQLGVTDYDLDTGLQLPVVPILTLVGRNRRAQDRYANASLSQNGLEPQRDVFLSRERGVDLAASALAQLLLDVGDHFALFGIENVLCQV